MPEDTAEEPFIPLDQLAQEEARLKFETFTEDDAWALGSSLVERARSEHAPVVINIQCGSRRLFNVAMPGSSLDNQHWVVRKGRVVTRFDHSSLYVGQMCRDQQTTLQEKFLLPADRYSPSGGAFPIRVAGVGVIGFIGVSGLPQVDDHRFVTAAVAAHLSLTHE